MLRKLQDKRDEGFTIIEVLIVLAIAGLILLIVLIAVPQLQRNQRNEARRNILSRMSTEINSFSGNNRGEVPEEGNDATNGFEGGFLVRYLQQDDGAGGLEWRPTFEKPQGGDFTLDSGATAAAADYAAGDVDEDTVYYDQGANCDGENVVDTGNDRDFSLLTGLEGGAVYCVDNGTN